MHTVSLPQLFTSLFVLVFVLVAGDIIGAWSGPSASPPGGNVDAPVNVGATDQVKNGGLSVDSFAVFGNTILSGNGGQSTYLNFGNTSGSGGYGFRNNAGSIEYRDSGGNWTRLEDAGGSFTETDPQVGTLTNGRWCTSNGSVISCTATSPQSYAHNWQSCYWLYIPEEQLQTCSSGYYVAGGGFSDGDDWMRLMCCRITH